MHVRESALRHVRVIGLFSHRMPELPDVTVYMEHLDRLVRGEILRKVRLASPFVVRSVQPPIQNVEGRRLLEVTRLGKRLVFSFPDQARRRTRPGSAAARPAEVSYFPVSPPPGPPPQVSHGHDDIPRHTPALMLK